MLCPTKCVKMFNAIIARVRDFILGFFPYLDFTQPFTPALMQQELQMMRYRDGVCGSGRYGIVSPLEESIDNGIGIDL